MELHWNQRYEAAKPRLVRQLQALMEGTDESQRAQAEEVVAAVRSLPTVGEHEGSLRIINRAARREGDSDFVYSLSIGEEGFELSHHERMHTGGGRWERAFEETLVNCTPEDDEPDEESSDEEALANMRGAAEWMLGQRISDEDWQRQVDEASGRDDLEDDVPNGILRWLEMIPVGDEGSWSDAVSVEWRPPEWT